MGNALSHIQPCSEVVTGKPEKGWEALTYLGKADDLKSPQIVEHSPAGIVIVSHSLRSSVLDEDQTGNHLHFGSSSFGGRGVHGKEKELSLHQELLVDLVYSVLHHLEVYFLSLNTSSPTKICRSVSFNSPLPATKERSSIFRLSRKSRTLPVTVKQVSLLPQDYGSQISGKQLTKALQNLFGLKETEIFEVLMKAKLRNKPKRKLTIGILRARNLRTKSLKDSSNIYCVVRLSNQPNNLPIENSLEVFRTSIVQECLEPCWNESFKTNYEESRDYKIFFEVWQEGLADKSHVKLTPKGFRKETKIHIGSAFVDLQEMDMKLNKVDDWLKLTKTKDDDFFTQGLERLENLQTKKRGELRVNIQLDRDAFLVHDDKRKFLRLLSVIAQSHASYCRDIEDELKRMWDGELTPEENMLVENYCTSFDISSEMKACLWWLVLSSEEIKVDQKHLCSLASHVQNRLEKLPIDGKDHEELTNSVVNWMNLQITKIKDLLSFYPTTSEIHSQQQLTFSLRTVKILEENMSPYLLNKTVHPFNICISEALQDFLKSWWEKVHGAHRRSVFSVASKDVQPNASTSNWKEGNSFLNHDDSTDRVVTLSQLRGIGLNRSLYEKSSRPRGYGKRKRKYSLDGSPIIPCEETLIDRQLAYSGPKSRAFPAKGNRIERQIKELEVVVECLKDVLKLLEDISRLYNPIFYSEFKVPFFRTTFVYLSNKLVPLIEPLLQIYSHYEPSNNLDPRADPLALEFGTPTYEIYKGIRKLEELCKEHEFSCETRLQLGLKTYWRWLSKGVDLWLQRLFLRAKESIIKDIQNETFVAQSNLCSSSAMSVIELHNMILSGWKRLCWPREDCESQWILKIGEVLISLGAIYGKKIKAKLASDSESQQEKDVDNKSKACTTINNLTEINDAILKIPELLEISCLDFCQSESEKKILLRKVQKCCSELNAYVIGIFEAMIAQITPLTLVSLLQSTKLGNSSPLCDHLRREIEPRKALLLKGNYTAFLSYIWSGLLNLFQDVIENNKKKQKHTFFLTLSSGLKDCLTILKSENEDFNFEEHVEHEKTQKQLNHLTMSNEALLSNFYSERFKEQEICRNASKLGEIVLRACINQSGILNVNVILANDLHVPVQSVNGLFGRQNNAKVKTVAPNTYVSLKLVPSQMFANISAIRTKVQKKSTNPVYDATCEFSLGNVFGSDRIELGFLLASVYSRECFSGDQFIGEALLPLSKIPRVLLRTPTVSKSSPTDLGKKSRNNLTDVLYPRVPNVFLKITTPKSLDDYILLDILKLRTWDKSANRFLREIRKHST